MERIVGAAPNKLPLLGVRLTIMKIDSSRCSSSDVEREWRDWNSEF